MSQPERDRDTAALVDAYRFLQDIARRHRDQMAALAEAERTPKPQPNNEQDEELRQAA